MTTRSVGVLCMFVMCTATLGFLLLPLALTGHTTGDCIEKPCYFSTNWPYDATGEVDTRPQTWGKASASTLNIPFKDVPAGKKVHITRIYGDFIGWPHGMVIPGTYAGILTGFTSTDPFQSPYVAPGLGSRGCFLYLQHSVGPVQARAAFDTGQIDAELNSDNILQIKQAVFENETGVSIHMETTAVVWFKYGQ